MSIIAALIGCGVVAAVMFAIEAATRRADRRRHGPRPDHLPRPTWHDRHARHWEYRASRHHHMR